MNNIADKIRCRTANETDIPFIMNSWLKSFRVSKFAVGIPANIYFTEQHKLIERLLKTSHVIMAVNMDDPTQVYGWICAEEIEGIFCLHYIYVKHAFRSLSIGKMLFNLFEHGSSAGIFTHHTRVADRISDRFNMIYHPYVLTNYVKEPKNE